jgi:hypothetical protein
MILPPLVLAMGSSARCFPDRRYSFLALQNGMGSFKFSLERVLQSAGGDGYKPMSQEKIYRIEFKEEK